MKRKAINKIIASLLFISLFTFAGDIIPRTIYHLRTFDSFVSELSYNAAANAIDGVIKVEVSRKIKQDIPAKLNYEVHCYDEHNVQYEVVYGQQERYFHFDFEKGIDKTILYEKVSPRQTPQMCKIDYFVTLLLPYGIEKSKKFSTGYFHFE